MYQVKSLKLITGHLKRSFLALFIIIALFFIILPAQAETIIYEENFDNPDNNYYYTIGWGASCISGLYAGRCIIWYGQDCFYQGTINSSWLNTAGRGFSAVSWYSNNNATADMIEFIFKTSSIENEERGFYIYIYAKNTISGHEDLILKIEGQTINQLAWQNNPPIWYQLGDIWQFDESWNFLRVEIDRDIDKLRIKYNYNPYTLWQNSYTDFDFDYISKIQIGVSWVSSYIDNFKIGSIAEFYSECGGGNYLQFCNTEDTCEYNGGYWSNNFCYEEQISIIGCDNYYAQNSGFSTPTAFYNSLCGFVSTFLQNAGNFLATFKNNFDITQATEKGYLLGSAISQARGYLDLVNDFFGGLPVADMMLLFIIVVVLVAVIRIVMKIIHIIKP